MREVDKGPSPKADALGSSSIDMQMANFCAYTNLLSSSKHIFERSELNSTNFFQGVLMKLLMILVYASAAMMFPNKM